MVVVRPVGDGTGDLRAEAEHLAEVAEQALRATGAPSVDVIGYSAGGVVARLWVRDEGGAEVARRVLTLGSPHHGTSQAALGPSWPAAARPRASSWCRTATCCAGSTPATRPRAARCGRRCVPSFDQVVTPVESAALDGALNILVQDVCPGSTAAHGDLPGDPVTSGRARLGAGRRTTDARRPALEC